MAFVVVSIVKPKALIRGILRNIFFEVQPCLFVGSLDAPRLKELVELIECGPNEAVLCVSNRASATGYRVRTFGNPDRKIVEIDGIQFCSKKVSINQ